MDSTRTLDSDACRLRHKVARGGERFVGNVWASPAGPASDSLTTQQSYLALATALKGLTDRYSAAPPAATFRLARV